MRSIKVVGPLVFVCALVAFAIAEPMPKGRWKALLAKDAKWTLPLASEDEYGTSPTAMIVEVTEVRTLASAQVVRLTYKTVGGDDNESDLPEQVAFTKKGIYMFGAGTTDAAIKRALKRKPTFADPGSTISWASGKNGTYALIPREHPEAACYGFAADPTCGANPCEAWICFDDTGVVAVGDVGGDGAQFGFEWIPAWEESGGP